LARRVVAISQTTGAAAEDVARAVAGRLGFRHVDDEIVKTVAERQGVDVDVVADVEKRRSFLEAFFEALDTGEAPEIAAVAVGGGYVSPDAMRPRRDYAPALRELIREAIVQVAGRGDVVVGSHAASFALAGRPDLLRVLVTASPEARARRVAEERRITEREGLKSVEDSDAGRRDYLKRFYGVDQEGATHYDLVLNTDTLEAAEVVDLIVRSATG
jgi:cytidylate kinase